MLFAANRLAFWRLVGVCPRSLLLCSPSLTGLLLRGRACTIESMLAARPSLALKIATANILLAIFAVLLAGMLQYRKEQRILADTMRQGLTQVVTSGALLIDGERAEELTAGRIPTATAPVRRVFQSLLIAGPGWTAFMYWG
jgi:hypothetical protein